MIELEKVSKRFGDKVILSDISLQFSAGQTHVLLGSSGCGKSTLLRMVTGLIPYDSGNIRLQGIHVRPEAMRSIVDKIGYVIQEGGLFPHLSARENVTLVARSRGRQRSDCEGRLKELASFVNIDEGLLERFPRELSGGQRQRIALMRALFLEPEILLLDEPLGALDPIIRADLQEQLKKIFDQLKKTVLIVTHDIGEAAYFGHTVTLLNEGRVAQHGPFESLMKNPADAFVRRFIEAQRPAPSLSLGTES